MHSSLDVGISTFRDHPYSTTVSTFRNHFRRIRFTACSWPIGFHHSTAIVQTTRSSIKLHTSCSDGGWFCALRNRTVRQLLTYLKVPAIVCVLFSIKFNGPYICLGYFMFTVGDSYVHGTQQTAAMHTASRCSWLLSAPVTNVDTVVWIKKTN